jgi:thiamine biosynthesis lipoprotein
VPAASTVVSRRTAVLLIASLLLLGLASWHRLYLAALPGPIFEFAGDTMGTRFLVKVAAPEMPRADYEAIAKAIGRRLDSVTAQMSTWDPESELSRFNRHGEPSPFRVSPDSLRVFEAAQEVSELSGGAFDVTVGPLVQAWGFGARARVPGGPVPAELARLRDAVGWQGIRIDSEAGTLAKEHPQTVCDLSAIAKGYAVDRIAEDLERLGHRSYLVEVGGELRAGEPKPSAQPWRIAIEEPAATSSGRREIHQTLGLAGIGMATSGDYRSYYLKDGRRLSHTIDPRTGHPIEHALASVTVLHPQAMYADAFATALNVLGPEAGLALAQELGLAAHFIVREADGAYTVRETEAFEALRARAAPPGARLCGRGHELALDSRDPERSVWTPSSPPC